MKTYKFDCICFFNDDFSALSHLSGQTNQILWILFILFSALPLLGKAKKMLGNLFYTF